MRWMIYILTGMLVFISPLRIMGGEVDHWETILGPGSNCRYLVPGSNVDSDWILPEFNDLGWNNGQGGVGYGDGDDLTTIDQAISVYCRYHFEISDTGVIAALILDVDFDDGFVAYLNGTEVGRYNMGAAGSSTSWASTADGLHEAGLYRGMEPLRVSLDENIVGLLTTGDNVLAIEVHNESIGSSDLSSNVFLHAGIKSADQIFSDTPPWFYPPFESDSTYLPLMVIDTEGQEIPNEPRITARMGLIHNGPVNYNSMGDTFNAYDGQISIEKRGESTLWLYPKKSYSIETQTDSGTNNNVSLLGLPEENDFVLYGPYGDKSLIRNVLTYNLFGKFGHYAPRTRFIELVINGDYKGLYVLTEKIKRDKNRVAIAKITPDDTSAVDISGGYILRVDKLSGMNSTQYWESSVQPPLAGYGRVTYQYFDPKSDELTNDQKNYIKDHMQEFEEALVYGNYSHPETGYRPYLDIPSFIDLMILNEFSKDVDGFRLSHYFYKQKETKGGKLVSGPPWDYNLTYGNSDYTLDVHETFNWTYTLHNTVYWWAWIMQDPWFRYQLYCRWDELHNSVLSHESVASLIDSSLMEIEEAIPRNFQRWPIFGEYVWPNSFVGQNHMEEEGFLRLWINNRLNWMDSKWGGLCFPASARSDATLERPGIIKFYPNPSDLSSTFVSVNLPFAAQLSIRVFDLRGSVVFQGSMEYSGTEFAYSLPDLSYLPDGVYTIEVSDGREFSEMSKLIKQ